MMENITILPTAMQEILRRLMRLFTELVYDSTDKLFHILMDIILYAIIH